MAGDLNFWKGSDVPAGHNVKFERRGGWFVTKTQAVLAAIFVVILIIAAILLTKYFTEGGFKENEPEAEELPVMSLLENVHSSSYELLFNHSSNNFNGEMNLLFSLGKSTDKIILKFKGESVSSPQLQMLDKSNKTLDIKSMEYTEDNNLVVIMTSEMLSSENQYNLSIKFIGNINAEEKGVFKIPYKYPVNDSTIEDRWIIGASLAPSHCSLVFPCIDVSSVRPTFRLKILRPQNIVSVSNVHKKATRDVPEFPELQLDDYEWSPSMPLSSFSYFILPEYKAKTIQDSSTYGLNIWYPPHLENTTTPIAEAFSSLMNFYNDFFNSSLPVQRLSVVIIDGLVTDHPGALGVIPVSSTLVYSPENETFKRGEKLFYYLGRKLSDQWLANLVKFNSWNSSWLQEGLALYMADLAASQNFLSYDVSTFMALVQEKALEEEYFTKLPDFSTEDTYSPYKGAFLFHMLSGIIQSTAFRNGMQLYVEKWKFSNTEPIYLWECFNIVQENFNVTTFIKSWNKKGYPVVSADFENETLSIEQIAVSPEKREANYSWSIPITYTSQEEPDFDPTAVRVWLQDEKSVIKDPELNGSWIIMNPNYRGFFRANYSKSLWKEIGENFLSESSPFPSTVKAQLLEDSFSLASYGLLDYGIPLQMSLYLQNETQISPWTTVIKHLNYISLFLKSNKTDYNNFKAYLNRVSDQKYSRINKEEPLGKYLLAELMKLSCQHELSSVYNKWAEESFTKWFNQSNMFGNIKTLNPELRRTAYCFGNRAQGRNSTISLISFSRSSITEPYEEFDILSSITCTSNAEELNRILKYSLDVNDLSFSPKRTIELWLSLKQIPENSLTAFEFVKSNWASILEKFQKESDILKAILESSTFAATEESHLEDLLKLKDDVTSLAEKEFHIEYLLDYIIEKVNFNVNWRKNNLRYVKTWFSNANAKQVILQ